MKKSMNGETTDNPKDRESLSNSQEHVKFVSHAATAVAEDRAALAALSALSGDGDDDKKRRRRSSLLRRSLSSNNIFKASGSGLRPSMSTIAAAARADLKKKSRSLRDLPRLESDEDDEDHEGNDSELKTRALMFRSNRVEKSALAESSAKLPDRTTLSQPPKTKEQHQTKLNQDDEDSQSRRRPAPQRSGSFTSRPSRTIHTAVNPLDVTLQLHLNGDNYYYRLCPKHTGNNRVGVMVDLQLKSFLKVKMDDATTSAGSESGDGRLNRICEEIVRTVEEHWKGRFLLQVEQQDVVGYTLLSKKEAAEAVYDIFEETIETAEKEAAEKEAAEKEAAEKAAENEASMNAANEIGYSASATLSKKAENNALCKQSTLTTIFESTQSTSRTESESNNAASEAIGNMQALPLGPISGKPTVPTIFSVYAEQADVHKSALASLQRRKRRQYATTKISNLVTGRGLITNKNDDMSISSSSMNSGRHEGKLDERSERSFSSLPTDSPLVQPVRSSSEPIEYYHDHDDPLNQYLHRHEHGARPQSIAEELHHNPKVKFSSKGLSPMGKPNNRSYSDSYAPGHSQVRNDFGYQNSQGRAPVKLDVHRSVPSTFIEAGGLSTHEDQEDYEPFPAEQQSQEISDALQQFQEIFSMMPSPYNTHITPLMPTSSAPTYEMTSNRYFEAGNDFNPEGFQNAFDTSTYDDSREVRFAHHDFVQRQDIGFAAVGQRYSMNDRFGNINEGDGRNYNGDNDNLRRASSVRFQDPGYNSRRTSTVDFASRRSTRLSQFSQTMIQDLLFQLSSSGELNLDDDSDED